jgi:hypothetical protein
MLKNGDDEEDGSETGTSQSDSEKWTRRHSQIFDQKERKKTFLDLNSVTNKKKTSKT